MTEKKPNDDQALNDASKTTRRQKKTQLDNTEMKFLHRYYSRQHIASLQAIDKKLFGYGTNTLLLLVYLARRRRIIKTGNIPLASTSIPPFFWPAKERS